MGKSKEVERAIESLKKEAFWNLSKAINLNVLLQYVTKLEKENEADKAEIRLLKDIIKDCEKDNISKEKIREKKAIVEKKLRKPKARRINKRNGGLINGSGTKRKSSNRSNKRIKQK